MATILIVEDDDDLRELFAETLRSEKHAVFCAKNGEEALIVLADFDPTLVLLDIMMPGMNGIEVLDILEQNHRLDSLNVVVTSAVPEKAAAYTVRAYLRKPIAAESLVDLAHSITEGAPQDAPDRDLN